MITIMLRAIAGGSAKDGKAAAREICAQMGLPVWPRNPRISRSGTAGLAAAAICESGSLGIDVERIDPRVVDTSLLEVVLHPDERVHMPGTDMEYHFFSLWTRKEAVLKALGTGLRIAPTSIAVGWRCDDWQRVDVPGGKVCAVRSWGTPEGFAGAAAIFPEEDDPLFKTMAELGPPRILVLGAAS